MKNKLVILLVGCVVLDLCCVCGSSIGPLPNLAGQLKEENEKSADTKTELMNALCNEIAQKELLKQENATLKDKEIQNKVTIQQLEQRINHMVVTILQLHQQIDQKDTMIQQSYQQIDQKDAAILQLKQQISKSKEKLEELKSMTLPEYMLIYSKIPSEAELIKFKAGEEVDVSKGYEAFKAIKEFLDALAALNSVINPEEGH
jgi:predicted RNase H-like nuclease (RuvC/YqgF family)